MKKIWEWISWPMRTYMERRRLRKRIEELRKRDPFIYR